MDKQQSDVLNNSHFFTHKEMKGRTIEHGYYHYCKCGYKAADKHELDAHIQWILTKPITPSKIIHT